MDSISKALVAAYALLIVLVFAWGGTPLITTPAKPRGPQRPYEAFDFKRTYPNQYPDLQAYRKVMDEVATYINGAAKAGNPFDEEWQMEGPGNIGGRLNCIAVHPQNNNIIYTGTPTGGIYKTTNGGTTWQAIFDEQSQLSIATIVIDPVDPNTVYAGTGDPNISYAAFMGNGIYKSTDAGATWSYLGLAAQSIVSKIVIDPTNTQILYAGTMGVPFLQNNDRGLYKSVDGGATWEQVLFISTDAGIIDLVMDPSNPQVLYAAGWDRIRNNQQNIGSGAAARIYKTIDGGANWTILTNGLPQQNLSRINLDILPSNPQTLYASIVATDYNLQGLYKTTDGGQSWAGVSEGGLDNDALGGFGWYFSHFKVNPFNPDQLFLLGIELWKSDNNGQFWGLANPEWWTYEVHADKHDLVFLDEFTWLLATDGGLYKTTDGGFNWDDIDVIPNTQFYRVATNPHSPNDYYGGAQDNGTTGGNSSNYANWPRLFGGDGFTPVFDPNDQATYYFATQNGNIYYTADDGFNWNTLDAGLDPEDRFNWDTPYFLSTANPSTMYLGSNRVYKMEGAPFGVWEAISPDLNTSPMLGNVSQSISTLAESPLNGDFLYAGTTDGNVWRSTNGGQNWNNVTGGLPNRSVTSVRTSPNTPSTVYVTHSGYLYNDNVPHVHKSINNGTTWIDISGDLPAFAVNDILPFEGNDSLLFIATDAGVYGTVNAGQNWFRVGTNMPSIITDDVDFNPATGRLFVGTQGRSILSYSLDKILINNLPEYTLKLDVEVFPNPTTAVLNVKIPAAKNTTCRVFNTAGKQMDISTNQNGTLLNLNVNNLPVGIYYLVVEQGLHRGVKKFIKQ